MKTLISSLLLLLTFSGYTQKKTTVYHYKKLKSAEGKTAGNKKEGTWYYWTRTGVLSKSITYTQGIPDGAFVYYDTSKTVFPAAKWEQPAIYKACLDTQKLSMDKGIVKQKGFYLLGKKHGSWKEYYKGTLIYEINYANGVYEGESIEYWSTTGGIKTFTLFHNGWPNGPAREYGLNGLLKKEGHYENGLETGEWLVMKEADKYINHYEKGKLHGTADHYNALDSLVERYQYKNGLKNGPYFIIKGNGNVKLTGEYLDDKEHGWSRKYYKGHLETEAFMRHGKNDGAYTRYNKAELAEKGFYKNGRKDSTWTTFNQSGGYRCESVYNRDELVSETCYNLNGQKTQSITTTLRENQVEKTITYWYNSKQKKEETVISPYKKVIRSWNEKGKLLNEQVIDFIPEVWDTK